MAAPLTTTLAAIRAQRPCRDGWTKLLKHVGDMPEDAPLPLATVLDSNGVSDTLWVAYRVIGEPARIALAPFLRECVLRAIDHAERVLPIFEARRPNDDRPRKAIEAARDRVRGEIAGKKVRAAAAADAAAAAAAYAAAYAAAEAAADAATAAAAAAYAAAAADAATDAAAYAAAEAAAADAYAAYAAAGATAAARSMEKQWQSARLREYLTGAVSAEDS